MGDRRDFSPSIEPGLTCIYQAGMAYGGVRRRNECT
jgi:hypothetical protein